MRTRPAPALLAVIVLAVALAAIGCPCIRGPINSSEAIRWWLFSNFGASKVCPELLKRGVPLKLGPLGPNTVGRFFPTSCNTALNDANRSMAVGVAGDGYAYLPLARRVGFQAQARVEFKMDFRLESDATYVWGRFSQMLEPPTLRILGAENSYANAATQTPLGSVATAIGQGVATSEISKGFTVVRSDDGDSFTLGILNPPDKPPVPYKGGSDHKLLASDVTEVHASERDYLGPFAIEGSGQALFFRMSVQGAPIVVMLVDKITGDLWRQPYEAGQPLGPPPNAPLATATAQIGESVQFAALPPGLYYVVVENRAAQAQVPFGLPIPTAESVAIVTYAAEIGDKP